MAEGGALGRKATRAIEGRNWQGLSDVLKARITDESDELAQYWYAIAQFQLGKFPDAAKHFGIALKANPQSTDTGIYLARCALAMNKPNVGDAALEAFPADPSIALLVGRAWLNLYYPEAQKDRRWQWRDAEYLANAISLLERAAAIGPDSADAHQWLAAALIESGDYERALEHTRRATKLEPAGWEMYALMGKCLVAMDRNAEAAQAYKIAAEIAPAVAHTLEMERGKALYNSRQYTEAVKVFRKILKTDLKHRTVRYWLGKSAFGAGDYQLSMWAFIESRHVDKGFEALVWAGRCAFELGEYADAERLIQLAIDEGKEKIPDFQAPPMYIGELGLSQWYNGKREQGMQNLLEAVKRRPSSLDYAEPAIYFYWAILKDPLGAINVLWTIGTHGHAEDAIQGIKELMVDFPDYKTRRAAYAALGDILECQGKYRTALQYYTLAGRTLGRNAKVLAGWAAVYAGDIQTAGLIFSYAMNAARGQDRDFGKYGLGYTWLVKNKPEMAKLVYTNIRKESMLDSRDAGLLWAAIALKDESAKQLANPYSLLGMIDNGYDGRGENRGYEILAIIPGSPMDNTSPKLRVDDVVLEVDSNRLNSDEANEQFRKKPIPTKVVPAVIRRGDYTFEVEIDYPGAVKKLPKPKTEGNR